MVPYHVINAGVMALDVMMNRLTCFRVLGSGSSGLAWSLVGVQGLYAVCTRSVRDNTSTKLTHQTRCRCQQSPKTFVIRALSYTLSEIEIKRYPKPIPSKKPADISETKCSTRSNNEIQGLRLRVNRFRAKLLQSCNKTKFHETSRMDSKSQTANQNP